MIKSVLVFILCVAYAFMATAFYFWSINPGEWTADGRFLCAVMPFGGGGIAALASNGVTP